MPIYIVQCYKCDNKQELFCSYYTNFKEACRKLTCNQCGTKGKWKKIPATPANPVIK